MFEDFDCSRFKSEELKDLLSSNSDESRRKLMFILMRLDSLLFANNLMETIDKLEVLKKLLKNKE
jgi:hypothetical protein